jgi:predicted ATP-grasp superfamily ATP-dependent carboligase
LTLIVVCGVAVHNYNINGLQSVGVRIANVRVIGGSTGIELNHCDAAHVTNFVALNVRGVSGQVCNSFF